MFHVKGSDSSYVELKHLALLYLQVNAHILSACVPAAYSDFFFYASPFQLAFKSVPALLRSWLLKTELSFRGFTTVGSQIFFPSTMNSHGKCLSSWHFCKTLLSPLRGNTGSEFSWDSFIWVWNFHVGLVFCLLPSGKLLQWGGQAGFWAE